MRKLLKSLFIIFTFISYFSMPIYADTGPKPSVIIEFEGINEPYYATLLSIEAVWGPYSKEDHYPEYSSLNQTIWEKFNQYEDDYYFIGYFEECSETHEFTWGYWPPEKFKVLIYQPESDSFIETEVMERYAFDSYFTVNVNNDDVSIKESFNHMKENISFCFRMICTILIEIMIAWCFKLTSKKQLFILIIANILTQLLLNVNLSITLINQGYETYLLKFFFLEVAIFIIEALSYNRFINSKKEINPSIIWLYSFTANATSYGVGLLISNFFKNMF